jgi:hypothetical protein
MAQRTRTVERIWTEVNRILPHSTAGSRQNEVRHAVSYFLKGDLTAEERIAKATVLVEETNATLGGRLS